MKALGIIRNVDALGRIVIPMETRKANGWEPGTPMEMFSTEEGLLIRKYSADEEKAVLVKNLMAALDGQALTSGDLKKAIAFIEQK